MFDFNLLIPALSGRRGSKITLQLIVKGCMDTYVSSVTFEQISSGIKTGSPNCNAASRA